MRLCSILIVICLSWRSTIGQASDYEEEKEETFVEEEDTKTHEKCLRRLMDLVFMLDESSSIPPRAFDKEKELVADVIKLLDVGESATRVGLVTFSDRSRTQFSLNRWYTKSDMLFNIKHIVQQGGNTATGDGLEMLRSSTFTLENGARMNDVLIPKVIIVITDGNSQRHDLTVMEAMKTKVSGITIFSVAVGENINDEEIREIASNVDHVVEKVEITAAVAACSATPPPEVEVLPDCKGIAVDVIFVIDTSNSITDENFEKMIDFMAKLVMTFDIGSETIRVAVITFANRPKAQINLDDYSEKISLAKAIYAVHRQYGGSYTFCAIDLVLEHGLLEEYGARKDVAKVGLILTDGKSADPERTELRAAEARAAGIRMIAVGIGDQIDREELKTIAGDDRMIFTIDDFDQLQANILPLAKSTCKNIPAAPKATEAPIEINRACSSAALDVIFLIDSSDRVTNTEYSQILQFLQYVAMTINLGPTRVRMGIIQYGRSADIVVELNKFSDRKDLSTAIKRLRRTSGYTNTANALNLVRQRGFLSSTRQVAKVAVVLTTGQSDDVVDTARNAHLARRAGITLYAIGVGQAKDSDDLMAVTDNTLRIYTPETMVSVKTLADTLVAQICGEKAIIPLEPMRERTDCQGKPVDVGLILDNSGSVRPHQYVKMMQFVENLVLALDVGRDKTRITVVTYANDAQIRLKLDELFDGMDIVHKLMSMKRQTGGTNTAEALRMFREEALHSNNGGRSNVAQIGIVVTDGKSKDTEETIEETKALRGSGVVLFVVGVGGNLDQAELEAMAGPIKKNLFISPTFGALVDLSDKIAKLTCEVPRPQKPVPLVAEGCKGKPADVILVLDNSGSIRPSQYVQMMDFLQTLVLSFDISKDKTQIGVLTYANFAQVRFHLKAYSDPLDVVDAMVSFKRQTGGTNTADALKVAREEMFRAGNGARANVLKVIIVVTDGKSRDTEDTLREAVIDRGEGIVIFAVGVGNNLDVDELKGIAGLSNPERVFQAESFEALMTLNDNIIKYTCEATLALPLPATTMAPPKPTAPPACVGKPADVALILDNSGSIRPDQYKKMMEFVETLVLSFDVAPDKTRIAAITFANDAELRFDLNKYNDGLDVVDALNTMQRQSGGTNTGQALQMLREQTFQYARGARPGILKVAIVITDGKSRDTDDTLRQAAIARSLGYILYAVGVGTNLDIDELEGIAGLQFPDRFYSAETFEALVDLNDKIVKTTCDSTPAPERPPIIEKCKTKPADIIFVLDNSGSISNVNYGKMMTFVEDLVLSLDVSVSNTHVAAVTFANNAQIRFFLNKYQDALDIVGELMAMRRQTGGTNTAEALQQTREQVLHASNGARAATLQVVIVITDGKSGDTPATLQQAQLLRNQGSVVFSIGVGTNLDMDELKGIAGDSFPDRMYSAESFDALVSLHSRLIEATCDATPAPPMREACVGKPADVALILDNSGSIRPDQYKKMMEFIETLVLAFDVGPEKTQIATITFADDAEVRFNLNRFADSLDVVDMLTSMKRQSGGTNTGDALKKLRDVTFKEGNGARPGVLKVAIVITDGKSRDTDDTLRQAAVDRSLGYVLYAVGVGTNLDVEELQGIAGLQFPERYYSSESFEALVSLNDRLIQTTCEATPEPPRQPVTENCLAKPADIIFVLDNSGSVSNVNYGKMMTFVEDLILSLDVSATATQIATVTFANDAQIRFFLNKYHDVLDIVGELMAMRRQTGGTNTAEALQITRERVLDPANGARQGILKVIMVITDGKSRDTPATLDEANKLRQVGAVVFSVGVGTNLDMDELKGIAGDSFPDRMYSAESFDALVSLHSRLVQATCDASAAPLLAEVVSTTEATIQEGSGEAEVKFADKYNACIGKPADVALILDNSGSVRPDQYKKMMEFVETLVLSLDIGLDKTRVAAMTFANDVEIRFDLDKFNDGLDVVDALITMKRQTGGTNTGQALQFLREQTFQYTRGARPGILKVAIVITDGKSRDTDDTLRQAAIDRSLGYVLFAVGVGTNLDTDELEGIAGLQYPERYYSAETFEALVSLNDKIIQTTCDATPPPARPPITENCKSKPADIIFVLDNSGSISNVNYGKMMTFVEDLVLSLDVGASNTQIAAVTFANDAQIRFFLNKYHDVLDIVGELMAMRRQTGGTNTSEALKITREQVLHAANGARDNLAQIVIVITDGKSGDTEETMKQASMLRLGGVIVFSLGVGTNLDIDELKGIAGDNFPDRMYSADSFDALVSLHSRLIEATCDVTPAPPKMEACVNKPADVALILDNSGSIRPNQYRQMMEFVQTLVLSFDIGLEKTRIGLITYADDAQVRFHLNQYDDALDLVDAMMTMRRQSGGTNTADALKLLREVIFQEANGARPGILKVGIVITDGKSRDTDQTIRQAAVGRSLGYVLYAVGVGLQLDIDELHGIAGLQFPDRYYNAETFEALVSLNDRIVKTTCDSTPAPPRPPMNEVCTGKPADVFFVLDNSGSVSNINYGKMMTFVEDLTLSFDVGEATTRIGVVTYANDAVMRFHLNKLFDSLELVGELMAMQRQTGGTNTADALKLVREEGFQLTNGARQGVLKVAIVITDGKSRDTPATLEQAALLRKQGVVVFAIGVGQNLDLPELKGIAGEEFVADRFHESETFDALVDLNVKIVQTTCEATPPPAKIEGAAAVQMKPLSIRKPSACVGKPADVVLVLDNSGSIRPDQYTQMMAFVETLVLSFDIAPSLTRIGAITFANDAKIRFDLNTHSDGFDVVNALMTMERQRGGTNTGEALQIMRTHSFQAIHGARPGILKVGIVITDGKSRDTAETLREAAIARSLGYILYVVGVGTNLDIDELEGIAGLQFPDRFYSAETFEALVHLNEKIIQTTCDATVAPERGALREDCVRKAVDLIFIVDNSRSVSNADYGKMMTFVQDLILSLDVSKDNTRVAVIMNDVMIKFYFNTYNDSMGMIGELMSVRRFTGSTDTVETLRAAREELLKKEHGARDGVVKVAILITGDKTHDTPKALDQAGQLRSTGTLLFAIGVGKNVDLDELKGIAGEEYPDRAFVRDDFDALVNLNDNLVAATCEATPPPMSSGIPKCKDKIADVVLLLDRSTDLSDADYTTIQNHVVDFVGNFDIGPTKTQISAISATGEVPTIHFRLKDFSKQSDIVNAIRSIPKIDGINSVSDAMKMIREDIYTEASGARPDTLRVVVVFLNKKVSQRKEISPEGKLLRAHGDTKIISLAWVGEADFYEAMDIAGEEFYDRIIEMPGLDALKGHLDTIVDKTCNNNFQLAFFEAKSPHAKPLKPTCNDQPIDAFLLLHSSVRTPKRIHSRLLDTAQKTLLNIQTQKDARLGLIAFAKRSEVVSGLTAGTDVMAALANVQKRRGGGNVSPALKRLCSAAMSEARTNATRFGVLIVDRIKKIDVDASVEQAKACRQKNINLYAIAVGNRVQRSVLAKMTSDESRVYISGDLESMSKLSSDLKELGCKAPPKKNHG